MVSVLTVGEPGRRVPSSRGAASGILRTRWPSGRDAQSLICLVLVHQDGLAVTYAPPSGLFRPLHGIFPPAEESVCDQNW
jgi:hypothetical protein